MKQRKTNNLISKICCSQALAQQYQVRRDNKLTNTSNSIRRSIKQTSSSKSSSTNLSKWVRILTTCVSSRICRTNFYKHIYHNSNHNHSLNPNLHRNSKQCLCQGEVEIGQLPLSMKDERKQIRTTLICN